MIFTKLHTPQVNEKIIHRTHLFEKLNKGLDRKLILISATAGYGKTTLISDWIKQNDISVAWCSLDSRDNDPIEFLKLLITAVKNLHKNIGSSSLDLLETPGTASIKFIIELFINDLLQLKSEIVLVLDDLHLIENQEIYEILSALIEYKPGHLKLIISTRSDPPFSLARLRSQNEMLELRSKDLSFSKTDIHYLFNKKLNLGLSENDLNILQRKTEGWIAGLQLTALTIQEQKDISGYLQKMAGDNRYIMDYLMEEVLQNQSKEVNQFLLHTSLFERLSGSLCDAVLSKENSQVILESLEKKNLFLISLDSERQWFRYHHLFGDLLQNRLLAQHKEIISELHQKASRWFEENNLPQYAIEHCLHSGNSKRAIALIHPLIEAFHHNLEYYKILKYGSLLSNEDILSSNSLSIIYAWTMAIAGKFKEAEYYLNKLQNKVTKDNVQEEGLIGKILLTQAYMAIGTGAVKKAFENSELALEHLPPKADGWKVWAYILNGEAHLLRFDLENCFKSYNSALKLCKQLNGSYSMLSVSKMAYALLLAGRYEECYVICNRLLEDFKSIPSLKVHKFDLVTSLLYSIIGFIQIERNELNAGFENVSRGKTSSQKSLSITLKGYCAFNFAEACFKLGKKREAIKELEKLQLILENDISIGLNTIVVYLKNKLLIGHRKFEKVTLTENEILKNSRNDIFSYYHREITKARYRLGQSDYLQALNILNELAPSLKQNNAIILLLEVELMRAKSFYRLKEMDWAMQSLSNAILLAQPEGMIRTFIIEGEEIFKLLKELRQIKSTTTSKVFGSISKNFLNELISAFEKENIAKKSSLEEVLSNRELDTIQLIAKDLTNQEIANELFISITTVKTHVRNILQKLDAKNRIEAVDKAKEKGILVY